MRSLPPALTLALVMTLAPDAHAGPRDDARDAYNAGKAAFDTGDALVALENFREAYRLVLEIGDDDPQKAVILEALLFNTVLAERDAFGLTRDVMHLRKASTSCRNLLNLEQTDAGTRQEYEELCVDVGEDLAAAEGPAEAEAEPEPESESEPESPTAAEGPEPEPVADVPASDDKARASILIGVAVGGTGVVALGAGIGLAVYGTTFERSAIQSVRDNPDLGVPADWEPSQSTGDPDVDMQITDQLDRERQKGKTVTIAGGVTAGVGAALVATGAVFLVRGMKSKKGGDVVRVMPGLGSIRVTF